MSDAAVESDDPEFFAYITNMTTGAADLPASRVLDPLVGTFKLTTEWEPIAGRGLRRAEGLVVGSWVFGGRMLEVSQRGEDDVEVARQVYAWDVIAQDYVSFQMNVLSTFYVLERGTYDADEEALVFEADQHLGGRLEPVRFRRSIHFLGPDQYVMGVTHPDAPPGRYGPLHMTLDRIA